MRIDLNSDLGEAFGPWPMGQDAQLMPLISSANVACGFHAGDPATMRATVRLARRHGVAVGAHPGFPDLVGFGRRDMQVAPADVEALVLYAFSEENWQRPQREIDLLFKLLLRCLVDERPTLMRNGVRLLHAGRRERLAPAVLRTLDETIALTAGNTGMLLCLAISTAVARNWSTPCNRWPAGSPLANCGRSRSTTRRSARRCTSRRFPIPTC